MRVGPVTNPLQTRYYPSQIGLSRTWVWGLGSWVQGRCHAGQLRFLGNERGVETGNERKRNWKRRAVFRSSSFPLNSAKPGRWGLGPG